MSPDHSPAQQSQRIDKAVDSGDYAKSLDIALELIGYRDLEARRADAASRGVTVTSHARSPSVVVRQMPVTSLPCGPPRQTPPARCAAEV